MRDRESERGALGLLAVKVSPLSPVPVTLPPVRSAGHDIVAVLPRPLAQPAEVLITPLVTIGKEPHNRQWAAAPAPAHTQAGGWRAVKSLPVLHRYARYALTLHCGPLRLGIRRDAALVG